MKCAQNSLKLSVSWRNFPYSVAQGIFGFEQGNLSALAGNAHGIAVGSFAFAGCRLDFDRQLMVQFRGSVVTSALLDYRELDDALEQTTMAGEMLAEARTGRPCGQCRFD